jgi:hypothetical protein
MLMRAVPTLLLIGWLSGCYAHRPVPFSTAPTGEVVRVHLTDAGIQRMEETFGVRQRQIQGEVVEARPDHLLLTFYPPAPPGSRTLATGRRDFRMNAADVLEVELRELNGRRTTALLAGGGLALSLGFYLVKVTDGGGPLPGPGGPGDFSRIPFPR